MDAPRTWHLRGEAPDRDAGRQLGDRLLIHPVAGQVLWHRGLREPGEARRFLRPKLTDLIDPRQLAGMDAATERLALAVQRGEPILLFGDYDVDGMCGTALLLALLRQAGARVRGELPCRLQGGYGLSAARVEQAASEGVRLIVAIDNGTSAFCACQAARAAGIDLVICDHHEPRTGPEGEADLPPAVAILNPKVPGAGYPERGLCGTGVAFKLAWALAQRLGRGRARPKDRDFLLDALALVAIATVADAMPLRGENRQLVAFGLKKLGETKCPGLRALLRIARVHGPPDADTIGFQLGPRLNAAGRLGQAGLGLELLSAADDASARALAHTLDDLNRRRRAMDQTHLREALLRAEASLARTGGRAIVLGSEGWHPGVVGIVAGRLTERFGRPAVLLTIEGGRARGSARSIPGVPIHEALAACDDLLTRHGGHAQAAGLELDARRLPDFERGLGEAIARLETGAAKSAGPPPLEIDAEVSLLEVDDRLQRDLGRVGPFGVGHPRPVLAARGCRLTAEPRVIGRDGTHLTLSVGQGSVVRRAVGFRLASRASALEAAGPAGIDVAFRPMRSHFRGRARLELLLEDVRPTRPFGHRPDVTHYGRFAAPGPTSLGGRLPAGAHRVGSSASRPPPAAG